MAIREHTVMNGDIRLRAMVQGEGPVVLCVHGWPELWYSWRHQMLSLSAAGYRVAALDVRGYGGSSKPWAIEAYTMREIAGDVAAVARHLSSAPVVLVGHDWGAPIVYNSALLYPELVRGVAGLSVPYVPPSPLSFLDMAEEVYADRFVYQLYFQQEGVAEAELEADVPQALRKIYFGLSGGASRSSPLAEGRKQRKLLQFIADPTSYPSWMSEADLMVFARAFEKGGLRGPLNRYRAQRFDPEQLADYHGRSLVAPTCFIAGELDPVRAFVPGTDSYASADKSIDDFRGKTLIPGVGHWVQQEAPDAVNAALLAFLRSLDGASQQAQRGDLAVGG